MWLRCTMVLLFFLFLVEFVQAQSNIPIDYNMLLKRVRAEREPAKRIELLNPALSDASMKSDLRATLLFERAQAHKALNDCTKAIEDLNLYLALAREIFPALLEKIHCLILLDQGEEASSLLEFVLMSRPATARAYVLKGMLYEKGGFPTKAEGEYTRALDYDPELWEALLLRARILLEQGRTAEALQDVNALTRLRPEDPEVFRMRAKIHVRLREYHAALADYRRVESLVSHERLLQEKVLVFFKMGNPEKALEMLETADLNGSDDAEILVLKAFAYIQLKDHVRADRCLKLALGKKPAYAPIYLYRGLIQAKNRSLDAALESFNRAIELDPKNVEALKERARIFMELDEPVRAYQDLTAAAELDHDDTEILAMRGATLVRRKLYDAAIADFSKSLTLIPGDPLVLYDRAVAFYYQEDYISALADLDAVIAMKPDAGRAFGLRGVIHSCLGNNERAREDLDRAVTLLPRDPLQWNNRGFFLYKLGYYSAALENFNHALRLKPDYAEAQRNASLVVEKQRALQLMGQAGVPTSGTSRERGLPFTGDQP